jgi:hypothetical protein
MRQLLVCRAFLQLGAYLRLFCRACWAYLMTQLAAQQVLLLLLLLLLLVTQQLVTQQVHGLCSQPLGSSSSRGPMLLTGSAPLLLQLLREVPISQQVMLLLVAVAATLTHLLQLKRLHMLQGASVRGGKQVAGSSSSGRSRGIRSWLRWLEVQQWRVALQQ